MLYYYKWTLAYGWFGRVYWKVREGSYLRDERRGYRTIGEGSTRGEQKAIEQVKRCIEADRNREQSWLVGEGGNHLTSNLVTIEPPLNLITPRMRREHEKNSL